jgi:DNA modification methylase
MTEQHIERIGDAILYLGDCYTILPVKADVVVTDPPYGVAYATNWGGKFRGTKISGDESTAARDAALNLCEGTPALVFGSWRQPKPANVRQVLIWEKGDHVGMGDLSCPWRPNTEEIYVIGAGFAGHRGSSVLKHNAPSPNFTPEHSRHHPTEKPVALMTDLIAKCLGTTVLDPFMGSGSTGVACATLGRKFIGIELERKYFDVACERIAAAYSQGRLFA